MRIPFLDYITPRVFPKIRRDHRLKASGPIITTFNTDQVVEYSYSKNYHRINRNGYKGKRLAPNRCGSHTKRGRKTKIV